MRILFIIRRNLFIMILPLVLTFYTAVPLLAADRMAANNESNVQEGETLSLVKKTIQESDGEDNSEEMFAEYVDRLFASEDSQQNPSGRRKSKKNTGSRFTGSAGIIYSSIYSGIQEIAAGRRESAVFTFPVEDLGYGSDISWSARDLGAQSVVSEGNITDEAVDLTYEIFEQEIQITQIIHSLLADCPYELYWHDKTVGVSRETSFGAVFKNGEWRSYVDGYYVISLAVTDEFALSDYIVNTEKTGSVTFAADNAHEIVSEYQGLSDMEKLSSYREEICRLVSYNHEALAGASEYGNPWQLIWVFDKDETTNVVCEGYAKAFQYLCDLTTFENSSVCGYTVTGMMSGGTGEGPHMWNIMTLDDDTNYLADVTNSDEGTLGQDGELFLVPFTSGSVQEGYSFNCVDGYHVTYTYDSATIGLFTEKELTIAAVPYEKMPEPDPLEIFVQPRDVEAEANDRVILHIETNLEEVVYRWQWTIDGRFWKNCTSKGSDTDTFIFLMKEVLNGRVYRCAVTNGEETVYSAGAKVTLREPLLVIMVQPQDAAAAVDERVTLHLEANQDNAIYQWQRSQDGTYWRNCTSEGCNTDTFSFLMKEAFNQRKYRCKVTASGDTVLSDVITVYFLTDLEITEHPEDVYASIGDQVTLRVKADRTDVSYQWQYFTNRKTWKNCAYTGCNTDTFRFKMTETFSGRRYRCIITYGTKRYISDEAVIYIR